MRVKLSVFNNSVEPEGDPRTRWALNELLDSGAIAGFSIVPFGDASTALRTDFLRTALRHVEEARPDVLIWHKDFGRDLSPELVKSIASRTLLVYHDLDPWAKWIKPLSRNQTLLARHAHQVYLCGRGTMVDLFSRFRTGELLYSPHGYFDLDLPAEPAQRKEALLFIGSVHRRFARLLGRLGPEQHPGRTRAVGTLKERLGPRFKPYGSGYPPDWGIQPCHFSDQFALVAQNLATFAIDAAPGAPGYFSNRTPFSLACGSVHLKVRREGDEHQFKGCPGLIAVADANEAADAFDRVCSWSEAYRREVRSETREFAKAHLRMPDLYLRMIINATSDSSR